MDTNQDRIFKIIILGAGLVVALLLVLTFITIFKESMPSIKKFGLKFLIGKEWDPVQGKFGALPFIVGTFATSIIALILALPFSLAIALLLTEYYPRGSLSSILNYATDLLAGIPSVIYGFWGLFSLVPLVRKLELKFHIPPYGVGIFTASLILTIMIIPYAASTAREVIRLVPQDLKEAGLSLGATRLDLIRKIILPYARSGILAGILLAFGRALGETMAVTMVIGNSNFIPKSLFSPANTMASVIANEFAEATDPMYLSCLVHIALWLFIITLIVNMITYIVIKRTSQNGPHDIY